MEADAGKQLKPEKSGLVTVGSPHLALRSAWHWVTSQTLSSVEF